MPAQAGIQLAWVGECKTRIAAFAAKTEKFNLTSRRFDDGEESSGIIPRGPVGQGAAGKKPPNLRGDAIMAIKTEAASALIFWDGKRYAWYQQGD